MGTRSGSTRVGLGIDDFLPGVERSGGGGWEEFFPRALHPDCRPRAGGLPIFEGVTGEPVQALAGQMGGPTVRMLGARHRPWHEH